MTRQRHCPHFAALNEQVLIFSVNFSNCNFVKSGACYPSAFYLTREKTPSLEKAYFTGLGWLTFSHVGETKIN